MHLAYMLQTKRNEDKFYCRILDSKIHPIANYDWYYFCALGTPELLISGLHLNKISRLLRHSKCENVFYTTKDCRIHIFHVSFLILHCIHLTSTQPLLSIPYFIHIYARRQHPHIHRRRHTTQSCHLH